MANMLFKTKGNAEPGGKPRVYFTCHPADFQKYFERICEDLFKTHECAVYYMEDMSESIPDEDLLIDVGTANLVVVPVTLSLLSTPNRAMDTDIPYALREHIPVLPIMMEPGLDTIYARPDKFGELQYLNPISRDATQIPYKEKLAKYLESVLISDEMAKRIRAAFDAYIFLSYRKKDRRYANELMRLIHKNPECRDIAVWYDEFLTPGDSFKQSIEKILKDSKLFALLVTPNLLEEPDGKPNFVMGEEYPAAKKSGVTILPAEMETTDKALLGEKFADLPDCVDTHDDAAFRTRLLESISKVATTSNNDDPEHMFLIGLAYLDGIDVETDRQRGISLITAAAEKDLPEAMEQLCWMYDNGAFVALDYREAAKWAERSADHARRNLGEEHEKTLNCLGVLASCLLKAGDYEKTLTLSEKLVDLFSKRLGETHTDTLTAMNNLALIYQNLGRWQDAMVINEKLYTLRCATDGQKHPHTLTALGNLAMNYGHSGDWNKALEITEKVYEDCRKSLGETHEDTLISLANLAAAYGKLGNWTKAQELTEQVYAIRRETWGENHPRTLQAKYNLAVGWSELGEDKKACAMMEQIYKTRCEVMGQSHPDTLHVWVNWAAVESKLGHYKQAAEMERKAYELCLSVLGPAHPDTLLVMGNLAYAYGALGMKQKALKATERAYGACRDGLGEEHPDTITVMNNLAILYDEMGYPEKAEPLVEKGYLYSSRTQGPKHPHTIEYATNLAVFAAKTGKWDRALELLEEVYPYALEVWGPDHENTAWVKKQLTTVRKKLGNT